jgi:hypothetical protein
MKRYFIIRIVKNVTEFARIITALYEDRKAVVSSLCVWVIYLFSLCIFLYTLLYTHLFKLVIFARPSILASL